MLRKIVLAVVTVGLLVPAPVAAAARDTKAPKVTFHTGSGEALVGAPADSELSTVRGSVTDKGSGTKRVRVTYCAGSIDDDGGWTCGGYITTVKATLECVSPARRSCLWSATVPVRPGSYLVFAEARDRAGNVRAAGPIEVWVV